MNSRTLIALAVFFCLLLVAAGFYWFRFRTPLSTVDFKNAKESFEQEERAFTPDGPERDSLSRDSLGGFAFFIPPFLCPTADSFGFRIQVGLKLLGLGDSLLAEVKEKQSGLTQLTQFTFSRLSPSQIHADSVRVKLQERINGYLKLGRLNDLSFTAFDVVPPETP